MSLVAIVVALVVICLLWWAVTSILSAFGVGDPIATVVKVVFVVLMVLWLVSSFLGGGSIVHIR